MQKSFACPESDRLIKWIPGGRILHCHLDGQVIAIEDHSAAALKKIVKFLTKKPDVKTVRHATFNAAAQVLIGDIVGLDIEDQGGSYVGRINNSRDATNKIAHSPDSRNSFENVSLYVRVKDTFKVNMRYDVDVLSDGTILFQEHEEISSENLNYQYDRPLLNVYCCEV